MFRFRAAWVAASMKILVAVDSSNEAHEIAVVAKALFPAADHLIVSAVSPASYMVSDPIAGGMIPFVTSADAFAASQEQSEVAVKAAKAVLGDEATVQVDPGAPGQVICDYAKAADVDVIVVGRRAKGWLSHLFDPSVSEYVIRHAPCPVLVVREAEPVS